MTLNYVPVTISFGVLWLLWKVSVHFRRQSPLDNLPGPRSASWWSGNLGQIFTRDAWGFVDSLVNDYPGVARLHGLFGSKFLHIYDPAALQHILMKDAFEESRWLLESNAMTFGPGLVSAVGEAHRRQRKMLTPAFSTEHLRQMTPMFYNIAHTLEKSVLEEVHSGPTDVNMLNWMNRTALELVGQGGLGYSFDPLTQRTVSDPFGDALKALQPLLQEIGPLRTFSHYVKHLGSSTFRSRLVHMSPHGKLRKLASVVDEIHNMSKVVLQAKQKALLDGDSALREQVGEGKDIMSLLLKNNLMSTEDERLTDDEVLSQMSTLVFAATDTTSVALVQILHCLAQYPGVQEELRKEIELAGQGHDIPHDTLLALPLLDAICRETLRLYPPSLFVVRETRADAVVPLHEPIRGRNGDFMKELLIPRDTPIFVGIRAVNTSKAIWGDDALEWKPQRWLSPLPETVTHAHIPGVYSNLMTFIGGGRSCIGFKFSQLEMKIIVCTLLRSFKFSLPDNEDEIVWNLAGVIYPTVGKDTDEPSFPIKVERLM